MNFEIIPNDVQEQIEFYQEKMKRYTNQAKVYTMQGYEVPAYLLSLSINASVNIRHLKARLEAKPI